MTDTFRLVLSAAVIADAAEQLDGELPSWERDELLDTIEMHARALVGACR